MTSGQPLHCFTQLLGQERAKRMLKRSLAAERIPHAYIFKGPEGVGRRLFGQGLAAAINCRNRMGGTACGSCSSCKKISSGNHPDFSVITSEKGGIRIDQVRKLCRNLTYPPYESKMRVVILENVHMMRREAANCLLKTLEEPPADNLLILIAESSHELLATLTSRCQVIPFSRLQNDDTVTILGWHGVDFEDAQLLARLSEGSPGKALLLKNTEIIEIWNELVAVLSSKVADSSSGLGVVLKLAERMAELKDSLDHLFTLLKIYYRDLLAEQYSSPLQKGVQESKRWSSGQLFAKLRAIEDAQSALARNCNRLLVCEVLLFKLQ